PASATSTSPRCCSCAAWIRPRPCRVWPTTRSTGSSPPLESRCGETSTPPCAPPAAAPAVATGSTGGRANPACAAGRRSSAAGRATRPARHTLAQPARSRRFGRLRADERRAPAHAGTEGHQQREVALAQAALPRGLVPQQGDRGRGRVAVLLDVVDDLLVRDPQ